MKGQLPIASGIGALCLATAIITCDCKGAAFANLGFEDAMVPPTPASSGGTNEPTTAAFPGWTAYLGTTPQTVVLHNDFALGSSAIVLSGPNETGTILEGQFTAWLQAGVDRFNTASELDAGLGQTGFVPLDARSVQFKARFFSIPGTTLDFNVRLGGQTIEMSPLEVTPNYTLFAGDVSSFAGMTSELRITALADLSRGYNNMLLDSIAFSSVPVPEPTTFALSGLAAIFAWLCGRRRTEQGGEVIRSSFDGGSFRTTHWGLKAVGRCYRKLKVVQSWKPARHDCVKIRRSFSWNPVFVAGRLLRRAIPESEFRVGDAATGTGARIHSDRARNSWLDRVYRKYAADVDSFQQ